MSRLNDFDVRGVLLAQAKTASSGTTFTVDPGAVDALRTASETGEQATFHGFIHTDAGFVMGKLQVKVMSVVGIRDGAFVLVTPAGEVTPDTGERPL
jgi:hypothetical protein